MNDQKPITKKASSRLKRFLVEIDRFGAHIYRRVFGLPTKRFSLISPQLYLGGQYTKRGFQRILSQGFTAVVNMRETSIHKIIEDQPLGIHYLHLPTVDQTAPSLEDLIRGVRFIDQEIKAGGKVYVHCRAGEGRGPTMAAAYLIFTGLTLEDAVDSVRQVRSFIRPTAVQLDRLKELEKYLAEHAITSS